MYVKVVCSSGLELGRVGQTIVLMCQKSKSSYFKLIFPFHMKSYVTDSIFSPIGWYLGVAQSIFVFTK